MKNAAHYKQTLSTLRNVIDAMIEELSKEEQPSAPRQRRNLKAERVKHHMTNIMLKTWKKPGTLSNRTT